MELLCANFGAPNVERFPLFETGEEWDAGDLTVVVVLLLPALQRHKVALVFTHRHHAFLGDHQEVVFTVLVDFNRGCI